MKIANILQLRKILFSELFQIRFIQAFIVCIIIAPSQLQAADFYLVRSGGISFNYIYIEGVINRGDTDRFRQFVNRHYGNNEVDRIILNSPGGNLREGIALGLYIREIGASTEINSPDTEAVISSRNNEIIRGMLNYPSNGQCASACAYAFLGGVFRVAKDRQIGIHQFYRDFGDSRTEINWSADDLSTVMSDTQSTMGLLVWYFDALGDVDMRLLAAASNVEANDIYFLSLEEAQQLNVITGDVFEDFFLEPYGNGIIAASRAKDSMTGYDSTRSKNSVSQATFFCRDRQPVLMLSSDRFPIRLSDGVDEAEIVIANSRRSSINLTTTVFYRLRDGTLYAEIDATELIAAMDRNVTSIDVEFWLPKDFLGRNEFSKSLTPREVGFIEAATRFCI